MQLQYKHIPLSCRKLASNGQIALIESMLCILIWGKVYLNFITEDVKCNVKDDVSILFRNNDDVWARIAELFLLFI